METNVAEQVTTQNPEDVLKEGQTSTEKVEVSEEATQEQEGLKAETQKHEETKETEKTEQEKADEVFQVRLDTEVGKRMDSYREKRESDISYIDSLKSQIRGLTSKQVVREGNKRMEAVLAGDEEVGITPDVSKDRETALKEFNELYKDYRENAASVEETAQYISNITKEMPDNIVKEFGLDDSNPTIRAVNGVKFLEETVAVYKHNQNFLMAVEGFLPKGDELRKQIEEIIEGLSEFTDEKSKKLYLKDRLQGVKVTARKKPLTPSDTTGGKDWSKAKGDDLVAEGLRQDKNK